MTSGPGSRTPDCVKAIRSASDPVRKLTIYAEATRRIQARMAPLLLALRDASATEPEARQVWREISDRRAANMCQLVQDLDAAGGLRAGLSINEAADVIWATNSSELYVLLTSSTDGHPTATSAGSPRRGVASCYRTHADPG